MPYFVLIQSFDIWLTVAYFLAVKRTTSKPIIKQVTESSKGGDPSMKPPPHVNNFHHQFLFKLSTLMLTFSTSSLQATKKSTPTKRKVQEIELSSDDEDTPPIPPKKQNLKNLAPILEYLPKTKIKVTTNKSRLAPIIIQEPTEQEIASRMNDLSESDNSSPGIEVPPKVIISTIKDHSLNDFAIILTTIS